MTAVAHRPNVSGARFERVILGELLGQGAHSAVHRGSLDGDSIAVKLGLEAARTHDDRLAVRLRREAAALGRLAGRGVPRAYECGLAADGRPYLLLEHVSGQTLRARLASAPLSEREALSLGERLASTLARVHALGLVHRDVKPQNIIVRADGEPVLIDFGLVIERGTRRGELEGAGQVAGTFAYSAPEQAGMLARPIDGRADLYALGAVLFECMAGHPPFEAEDPGELLHQHATKAPPRLDALGHSSGVAGLVARLLAKDPDDRFADAAQLVAAIRALRGEAAPSVAPEPHEHTRMRPRELAELERALEQACLGRVQSALVEGSTGMGKTWLVDELASRASARGMELLRVAGRAQGDPAFGTLRRLLEEYVGRSLASDHAKTFRERVRSAAADFAPYLAQLVPSLRSCFALTELELGLTGTPELMREALVSLVMGLGVEPWLVVVDDAHWMDEASLDVLERVAERARCAICIVCTADADAAPMLAPLRRQLARTHVRLGPLDDAQMRSLLRVQLGPDPYEPALAAQLRSSSAGTPLAALAHLQAMIDGGVVGPFWGGWSFDPAALGSLTLAADAGALALERLAHVTQPTREILRRAALLDPPFRMEMLASLCDGEGARAVADALSEAVVQHVLWADDRGAYGFSHALLQKTLTDESPSEERSLWHARIADLLSQQVVAEHERDTVLYAIAHHRDRGVRAETARVAYEANLAAAQRALSLFAYEQAITFFEQAKGIAEAHGFEPGFRLYRGLAEAYVERGDCPRGLRLLELAAARCEDPIDRAEIHAFAGKSSFFSETSALALGRHLERGYAALGKKMPRESPWLLFATLAYLLVLVFHELTGLRRGSAKNDRVLWGLAGLIEFTGVYSMFNDAPLLMLHSMMVGYVIAWRLGDTRYLVSGSGAFGAAASSLPFARRFAPRFFARGYEVADALRDRSLRASVQHFEAIAHGFAERPVEAERAMLECLRTQSSWLDTQALVTVAVTLAMHRVQRGHVDAALEVLHRYVLDTQKQSRAEGTQLVTISVLLQAEAVQGKHALAPQLEPRLFENLDDPVGDPMRWLQNHATRVWCMVERGEPVARLREALDEAERTPLRPAFASWVHALDFFRLAEARYVVLLGELAERGTSEQARADRIAFERSLEKARVAARTHPIGSSLCDTLLAGLQRLQGEHAEALQSLACAEATAHLVDSPNVLYLARFERARVLHELGQDAGAERELEAARDLAERLGWPGRRQRAEAALRKQRSLGQEASTRATTGTVLKQIGSGSADASHLARDRAALLEVSLTLAGELEPGAQAVAALDILLRLLGGERAFIFERDEIDGLRLIAARDANGQDLDESTKIGRSLLERTCARRTPLVMSGTEEGAALGSESVVAENLRSIICAPLVLRDELVGAVYVDSRLAKGMFTARHLDILVAIANHIAVAQHMARLARHEAERRELAKDMQLAAAVQALILPAARELDTGGFSVSSEYAAAAHVGGDFFHIEPLAGGGVRALIADVTGHGAGSAMVTACVAGLHRAYLGEGKADARLLAETLHREFAALCRGQYAMTLSIIEVDASGRGTWLNAGGPPLLIHRASGLSEVLSVAGTPLGGDELELGEQAFQLERGESVLLFSDGLYEMRMEDGRELGVSRLRRTLARAEPGLDARALRDHLLRAVEQARGNMLLEDDRTLIVCTRHS